MTSVGARRCVREGARGARRHDRRASTRSAARSRNDVLAARRALAVVVAAQGSRRGDGTAATRLLSVRMTSVGARRCVREGARGARRHDRRASTRSAARSRNDVRAARRALAVVVAAQGSRRGDGTAATRLLSVRMTSVGARRCVREGARGARRHDRRASTRSAARSRNDVLAARRALAVVVAAQGSRRGDGTAATRLLSVRMTSVGARRCVREGARGARRHDRRASTRSAARSRNDVLAARRALAVVVAAQGSRRGDGTAATRLLSVRMTSVGARRCVREGARGARRHDRRASTRSAARSRNDVLAARRALAVVVAAQGSRRGDGTAATRLLSVRMTSARRPAVRPGGRTRRTTTRSVVRRRGRRRDQGTHDRLLCSRLGARSPSSWRLRGAGARDGTAATRLLGVRMTSVGARRCVRAGARGARRHDRRASTRSAGAIKERRARGSAARSPSSWRLRGAGAAMEQQQRGCLSVRMTSVGARRCVREGARGARRHDRRASTRSAARSRERRGSAARRALAVVVAAQGSRRGDGTAATRLLSVRTTSVGAPAVRPGGRTRRTTTRSACVDGVGGAIKERRARGYGARSPSSWRLRGAGARDGTAATRLLSVRMASVGARRCVREGARGARRHDRRASTRSAARSRNDVLAARRALAVVVAAQGSRRGDGTAATRLLSVRMTSVGARRCVREGARGARRHDRRASTRSAARSRNDVLAARRALAVVVAAQGSRRGDGTAATGLLSVRMTSVGARRCVREGGTRRTTTRSACVDEVRRRDLGTTCSRLGARSPSSWRLRGAGAAMEQQQRGCLSVRTGVGRRPAVRPGRGARGARRHDRHASTRSAARSRNDVLAARRAPRRRRGGSGEPARGDGTAATRLLSVRMTSVGARRVRAGRAHAAHDDTIGVRRRGRRRDQGTTCSRLGARSPSSWRLRGAGAAMEQQQRGC